MSIKKTVVLFALEISEEKGDFMTLSLTSEVLGDAGMKIAAEIIEAQDASQPERARVAMSILCILEDQIHSYYKDKLSEAENSLSHMFGDPVGEINHFSERMYNGMTRDEYLDDPRRQEEKS